MNVGELIEELNKLNPLLDVRIQLREPYDDEAATLSDELFEVKEDKGVFHGVKHHRVILSSYIEDDQQEQVVLCPVCGGTKQLSYQKDGGCQCCEGKGSITKEKNDLLLKIRRDLESRR